MEAEVPSREAITPIRPTLLIGGLPPPATGQSESFRMLVEAFARSGLSHDVLDLSPRNASRTDGTFSLSRALSYARPSLTAARLLLTGPRRNVYLLIAQSWPGFLRDAVFIALASLRRHRLVVHLKGGNYGRFYAAQSPARRWAIRRALARTDAILVLSKSFREHFAFVPGAEQKIQVVLNGLPFPEERLFLSGKRLPEHGPVRLLFLSNMIESKGYLELLDAVKLLAERGADVSCRFCGEFLQAQDTRLYETTDEARRDFQDRIQRAGLGDRVVWSGVVSGDEKLDALAESHFFVLPTRYGNEGQPVSIIEALASGCVVVSTRYRSIPEMLDEGRAGLLIDEIAPTAIADVIEALIRDPERYGALSAASVEQFRRRFRQSAHLARIVPLILGAAARADAPRPTTT